MGNWTDHILRRNCPLKRVIEGKIKGRIEVTGRRIRRRKQLLNDLRDRDLLYIEIGSTRSLYVKNSLWKRLSTSRKRDNRMNARIKILVFGLSPNCTLVTTYQTIQYCNRVHYKTEVSFLKHSCLIIAQNYFYWWSEEMPRQKHEPGRSKSLSNVTRSRLHFIWNAMETWKASLPDFLWLCITSALRA
jgi:hypothetical protein